MGQITLSRNELSALLTRACEVHYGVGIDYNAIAMLILNAECHGLMSVERFCRVLSQEEPIEYAEPFEFKHNDTHISLQQNCTDDLYTALWAADYITGLTQRDTTKQCIIEGLSESQAKTFLGFLMMYDQGIPDGTMKSCNAAAIESGITLTLKQYKLLNQVADKILVEATEESRRGAGE